MRRESQRLTLSVEELRHIVENSSSPLPSPRHGGGNSNTKEEKGRVNNDMNADESKDNERRPGTVSQCGTEEDHMSMLLEGGENVHGGGLPPSKQLTVDTTVNSPGSSLNSKLYSGGD